MQKEKPPKCRRDKSCTLGEEKTFPSTKTKEIPQEKHQRRYKICCCCCCIASVVSDSVRPRRRQTTRLPHPWDSPGKNTGVGCHFLLQCMKVKVKSLSCVRLLATPWTAADQAPLSMGFSRQEYWSGVPLPSPIDMYTYAQLIYDKGAKNIQ